MDEQKITEEQIAAYAQYLRAEERAAGTIEKYLRDLTTFTRWLNGENVTKERVVEWKKVLQENGYAAVTINSMLASLNGFFRLTGRKGCRVKYLKV